MCEWRDRGELHTDVCMCMCVSVCVCLRVGVHAFCLSSVRSNTFHRLKWRVLTNSTTSHHNKVTVPESSSLALLVNSWRNVCNPHWVHSDD